MKIIINEWETLLNCQVVSPVGINRQFDSFSKAIQDLARKGLLARVDIPMCVEISNYKNIIVQIRRNALKGMDPQINLVHSPPNHNSNSFFPLQVELIYHRSSQ